eukprot:c17728_g1_i1 orf=3-833(-)
MAQLIGAIASMMEKATKPPPPPVDRTLPNPIPSYDNIDELIRQAKEFYKMEKPTDFHVAVVGAKGAGKSSLINGLCNMRDGQPGAAGGESNGEAKPYRRFMLEAVVFWEMPGAGVGHPSATYFADKKLYAFDLLILVSDRFQRVDFEVAKSASRLNRRFIFVRTKSDLALRRIVERETAKGVDIQINHAVQMMETEVQASFREGLRLAGLADKWNSMTLYMVSAKRYVDVPYIYNVTQGSQHHDEDNDEDDDEEDVRKAHNITTRTTTRTMMRRMSA